MQEKTARIIENYAEPTAQESAEARIQAIDDSAKRRASSKAITLGVFGTLLLGAGMSLTMAFTDFFALGVVVGVVGLLLVCISYPLYSRTLAAERKAARPEIMRLVSELTD